LRTRDTGDGHRAGADRKHSSYAELFQFHHMFSLLILRAALIRRLRFFSPPSLRRLIGLVAETRMRVCTSNTGKATPAFFVW
jgi:hypothetical protein